MDQLAQERFLGARDDRGRLIAPNALLLALRLLEDPSSDERQVLAERLRQRLVSYAGADLPAPQRRFLMGQLARLAPGLEPLPNAEAEELAARFADGDPELSGGSVLAPSPLPGIWQLPSPNGRVIALYREETLRRELATWAGYFSVPGESSLALVAPSDEPDPQDPPLVSLPVDEPLSGWRLDLRLDRGNLYELAAERQVRAYRGTGVLVVGLILLLALFAGLAVRHQLRLTALKDNLLATVSHELKTPLASMRLLIDTLLDGGREEPGDRDALATAVLNLLDNAWKYTGEEKHIRLRTYAENGHVCFAVSDDGVGLSAREVARVFDRFFQVDRRLGRGEGGCGLGLSIVQLIVRAHGGEVAVESRRGRGSTFTLRLPAAKGTP